MKNLFRIMFVMLVTVFLASCVVHGKPPKAPKPPKHPTGKIHPGHKGVHLPPGQVKKITGSKTAKPYAPGQLKKGPHRGHK
jgi:hypothetical protein